jgi:hypothetical protein
MQVMLDCEAELDDFTATRSTEIIGFEKRIEEWEIKIDWAKGNYT